MKNLIAIILAILLILSGCGEKKQFKEEEFITVDVTANYPKKELILQDFMDVEYIPLETTNEFITKGIIKSISKKYIVVTNHINDGDIFIFDSSGKALRKINRLGQGGEEYTQTTEIILDEENNELFIEDYPAKRILVYDLYGNFRRSFKFVDTGYYTFVFNYDRDNLICYKSYIPDTELSCHLIISKQNGSVTREIQIPVEKVETPVWRKGEASITPSFYLTIPYNDNWILMNTSSDTIYNYSQDGNIKPLIVRTPSVHSMDPEVFLFPMACTGLYFFMKTMKKEFDLEKMKGFPQTDLVYDKENKTIYEYTLYNNDFSDKKQVYWEDPVSNEIVLVQEIQAPDLVVAYENGQLKDGKLKEIAATLDEESNPVIMLVKHKK